MPDGGGNAVVEVAQGNGNSPTPTSSWPPTAAWPARCGCASPTPTRSATWRRSNRCPSCAAPSTPTRPSPGRCVIRASRARVDGRGLSIVGVRVDSIAGRFAGDRSAVRSDGIRAAVGGGTLTASGTVALDRVGQNAWTVNAKGVDAGAVAALLDGLAGVARRSPAAPSVSTRRPTARGRACASPAPPASPTSGSAANASPSWSPMCTPPTARGTRKRTCATAPASRSTVRASGRGDQDLMVALHCDAWTLTSLWHGEQAEMGGTLRAVATLRGPARFLSGTATVAADDLVIGGRGYGTVAVDVTADRGRWRASSNLLDDALRLVAEVRPDPGLPFTFEGSWNEADASRLIGQPHGLQVVDHRHPARQRSARRRHPARGARRRHQARHHRRRQAGDRRRADQHRLPPRRLPARPTHAARRRHQPAHRGRGRLRRPRAADADRWRHPRPARADRRADRVGARHLHRRRHGGARRCRLDRRRHAESRPGRHRRRPAGCGDARQRPPGVRRQRRPHRGAARADRQRDVLGRRRHRPAHRSGADLDPRGRRRRSAAVAGGRARRPRHGRRHLGTAAHRRRRAHQPHALRPQHRAHRFPAPLQPRPGGGAAPAGRHRGRAGAERRRTRRALRREQPDPPRGARPPVDHRHRGASGARRPRRGARRRDLPARTHVRAARRDRRLPSRPRHRGGPQHQRREPDRHARRGLRGRRAGDRHHAWSRASP